MRAEADERSRRVDCVGYVFNVCAVLPIREVGGGGPLSGLYTNRGTHGTQPVLAVSALLPRIHTL
jgi:hypothetical protein